MQQQSSLRAIMAVLGVVVAVAGVVLLLYLDHFFARSDYLVREQQKTVTTFATRLKERIEAVETAAKVSQCSPTKTSGDLCQAPPNGVTCEGTHPDPAGVDLELEEEGPTLVMRRPCDEHASTTVRLKIDLIKLLTPLLEEEASSDYLVLARDTGEVLWQRYPQDTLEDLSTLVDERHARDARERDKAAPAAVPTLRSGSVESVDFAGAPHQLFVTKLELGVSASGTQTSRSFVLGSLVHDAKLRGEALTVPHSWLLTVALALVLVGLAWPLLKLWYIGPRERLYAVDVWLLASSAVITTAVVTAAMMAWRHHIAATSAHDLALTKLARTVEKRLHDEIELAATTLHAFQRGKRTPTTHGHGYVAVTIVKESGQVKSRHAFTPKAAHAGIRWEPTARSKPDFKVGDREYFKDAVRKRYWPGRRSNDPTATRVAVEAIESRLTADVTLVLATRVVTKQRPRIATISLLPVAFADPVVPPGTTIMVVDERGKVQLSSKPAASLRIDLVDACQGDSDLVGALRARRVEAFTATCFGRAQRLSVCHSRERRGPSQ